MQLDRFQPGLVYEVGTVLGNVLMAEQWAEPVDENDSSTVTPVSSVRQFAPESDRHHKHAYSWRRRPTGAHGRTDRSIAAERAARLSAIRRRQKHKGR